LQPPTYARGLAVCPHACIVLIVELQQLAELLAAPIGAEAAGKLGPEGKSPLPRQVGVNRTKRRDMLALRTFPSTRLVCIKLG
jgi:hypothetical protein